MDKVQTLTAEAVRSDIPHFHSGDTLSVHLKVIEGNKERVQVFTGVVIQISGKGATKTFTIRKIGDGGIGIERILPINSPRIEKIERLKEGRVRRARIFYIRDLKGKAARIKDARKK